jgi:hypothetical protein
MCNDTLGIRIHEGMCWGAAARDKNGANNLEENDHDNKVPKPIPPPKNHLKKVLPGLGVDRT